MAKPISIQLYTLRDAAAQDLPGVLNALAEIGFKGVEFAGLHGHDPREIRRICDDLGLRVSSSHTGLPDPENSQQIIDTEMSLGNTKIISGFGPDDFKSVDDCKKAADKFQQGVELVKPHGLSVGYHNHWWEFDKIDDRYYYDLLMEFAPDIFGEMDVYWVAYAKADPVSTVSKYKSRLPLLHIKDGMLEEGKLVHTAVGSGKLDMPAIIDAADESTLEWLIVELDACETDMMEAVKRSYEYLTSNGLASGNK